VPRHPTELRCTHPNLLERQFVNPTTVALQGASTEEYWAAGTAPILDIQGEDDPYSSASSRNELVEYFGQSA